MNIRRFLEEHDYIHEHRTGVLKPHILTVQIEKPSEGKKGWYVQGIGMTLREAKKDLLNTIEFSQKENFRYLRTEGSVLKKI